MEPGRPGFRVPEPPLTSCENLGSLLNLSFLIYKVGILILRAIVGVKYANACHSA